MDLGLRYGDAVKANGDIRHYVWTEGGRLILASYLPENIRLTQEEFAGSDIPDYSPENARTIPDRKTTPTPLYLFGLQRHTPENITLSGHMHSNGLFEVVQKEVQAQWPDPQCAANELLRDTSQDVEQCRQELERAYYSGSCSWPFPYGGVSYGERPIRLCGQPTGLLRHLATPKPARKVIRVYQQNRVLFRSVSYFCDGQSPLNPLPTKAQVQVTIEPQLPSKTMAALLDRLEGFQLNLDFPSFLKLIRNDYIQTPNRNLTITAKGEALLNQTDRIGLTYQRLYLILRLLENIQTDEAAYADVVGLVQRKFS